jgi:drug/metabolite transporter (DMT)-like permease
VGGNGLVTWAEQSAASGFAALVVASAPIWLAVLEAAVDRRLPSRKLAASLGIGFVGVAVLTSEGLGAPGDLAPTIALVLAPMLWSAASLWQQRRPVSVRPTVSAGWQMLFGAAGFGLLAVLLGEPRPSPTPEAWAAWAYLVTFGSVLAFTSFVQALRLLPASLTLTYAYVNPVFAALLGWWLLAEPITWRTVAGGALVLAGVAGVFHERMGRGRAG